MAPPMHQLPPRTYRPASGAPARPKKRGRWVVAFILVVWVLELALRTNEVQRGVRIAWIIVALVCASGFAFISLLEAGVDKTTWSEAQLVADRKDAVKSSIQWIVVCLIVWALISGFLVLI